MDFLKKRHFALISSLLFSIQLLTAGTPLIDIPPYNKEEISERLQNLNQNIIETKYGSVVESYIKRYVIRSRKSSEIILGRTAMYFPIFEKYLKENNLPDVLKYLPIVESALDPSAVSVVGAGGLWQFMPETGKSYGLVVNEKVDERTDIIKSTKAAVKHLADLYKRFDDWALALAAYNSGAGRVSKAIRRSGSRDFWTLKKYLPRETRNYVPAFIAAIYLAHHYDKHNLHPKYPSLDMQLTAAVELHDFVSFFRIAQITGLPLDVIRKLNPLYYSDYIPANAKGNFLILPKRVMPAFEAYAATLKSETAAPLAVSTPVFMTNADDVKNRYAHAYYLLGKNVKPAELAEILNCSVTNLMVWNEMGYDELGKQTQLKVYRSHTDTPFKKTAIITKILPKKEILSVISMTAISD